MSCSSVRISDRSAPSVDPGLIGTWSGHEKGNQWEEVARYWIQQRFDNGAFVLLFLNVDDCEVIPSQESGIWWTEEGFFYETYMSARLIKESG
ncbi:MAG: hypothetical protein ACOCU3_01160 [bacterium]